MDQSLHLFHYGYNFLFLWIITKKISGKKCLIFFHPKIRDVLFSFCIFSHPKNTMGGHFFWGGRLPAASAEVPWIGSAPRFWRPSLRWFLCRVFVGHFNNWGFQTKWFRLKYWGWFIFQGKNMNKSKNLEMDDVDWGLFPLVSKRKALVMVLQRTWGVVRWSQVPSSCTKSLVHRKPTSCSGISWIEIITNNIN